MSSSSSVKMLTKQIQTRDLAEVARLRRKVFLLALLPSAKLNNTKRIFSSHLHQVQYDLDNIDNSLPSAKWNNSTFTSLCNVIFLRNNITNLGNDTLNIFIFMIMKT